jgi:SAM-dependent methyltransferase
MIDLVSWGFGKQLLVGRFGAVRQYLRFMGGMRDRTMRSIYTRQERYFRKAYENGTHGWPVEGSTPEVATLIDKLGSGAGKTALDVGCGEGRHTILMAKRGYAVIGLDLEPLAVRKATEFLARAGASARLIVGNVLDLSFSPGGFDLVLDYGCFHHLVTRDWPRYRREIARVLKPGGHFVLSVFSTKFRHHVGERRSRNWIIHRNHYDHFFTRAEITGAFLGSFELKEAIEEHEGLGGYYHLMMKSKSRSSVEDEFIVGT